MSLSNRIKIAAGILSIAISIVWTLGFPKAGDFLKPDFVLSVAISVGLLATGCLLLFSSLKQGARWLLPSLLVWSVLGNVTQLAVVRLYAKVANDLAEKSGFVAAQTTTQIDHPPAEAGPKGG